MRLDESFARSLMLFCFGAAAVLFWTGRGLPTSTTMQPGIQPARISSVSSQAIATSTSRSQLVVDLSDRRVYVYREGKKVANYAVAVGQRGWETPHGNFKVLQMQRHPKWRQPITGEIIESGPDNPLGDYWVGFWTEGAYQIGFHGTNQESLVGKPVSHGCLRMRNQDIKRLYQQVSLGTPVSVRP
jgi:lipoprotein-anchoring transpeptidase ErfK/SrfK